MREVFLTEGLYSITDEGKVFSHVSGIPREMVLSPASGKSGKYLVVNMRLEDKPKTYTVHRLIAKAFVPNPFNKPCVNHKDGNPSNNSADNLEWTTQRENVVHALSTSLKKPVACVVCGREIYGHKGVCRLCSRGRAS